MPVLMYLLKMLLCSAVLYGYYHFFLRNRSFHLYNRFFLLLVFLLSIILPLLRFPFLDPAHESALPVFKTFRTVMLPEVVLTFKTGINQQPIDWSYLLVGVYTLVLLLLLFQLTRSVIHLMKVRKKYPSIPLADATLFITSEPDTPFSFFKWIFWNNNLDTTSPAGNQVLEHELYHIRERHTFDILFAECLIAVFWFNPFFYLIRKELKTIHEFLADQAAASISDKADYAELLLLHAIAEKKNHLTHSFFQNNIKRRITMITENNKTSFAYLRRIMCLPLLFILCIACSRNAEQLNQISNGKKSSNEKLTSLKSRLVTDTINITAGEFEKLFYDHSSAKNMEMRTTDDKYCISFDNGPVYVIPLKEFKAYADAHKNDKPLQEVQPSDRIDYEQTFTKMEIEPDFPGGRDAWIRFLSTTFRYPDEAVEKEIQGTVVVSFLVDKAGNISDVKALSGPQVLQKEAVRVISQSGKWLPGRMNGRVVKAYKKQPITFRLQSE